VNITTVNPKGLYDPTMNGYSHVVRISDASSTIYIAGQEGEHLDGLLPASLTQQVENAFNNLALAITAAGGRFHNTAKLTTYVVNHDETKLSAITENIVRVFRPHLPAQTLVPVPRLALDGMLFEVDAIVRLFDA